MKRFLALILALFTTPVWAASMDLGSQVASGKQLFESTCSASTCHGSGGVGAGGPKLVDRNLPLDLVRTTVTQGRPGTPMPAFDGVFEPDELASIIAYVLSISTGGRWATAVPAIDKRPPIPWPTSVIDGYKTDAGRGLALFYDATRATACRTCHSYKDNGGPVGRDLSTVSLTALEVVARLSKPVTVETVVLITKNGKIVGLKKSETDAVIRIVDISSLPPVIRSVQKVEVTATSSVDTPFDHGALSYTPQELRDAAALLGKAPSTK